MLRILKRYRDCFRRSFSSEAPSDWHRSSPFPYYDPWFSRSTRGDMPRTKTGGKYTVSAVPGVGIGVEMMAILMEVFDCMGAPINFEMMPILSNELEFKNAMLSVRRNGVAIKGNIEEKTPMQFAGRELLTKNSIFRKELDLFVNVTHIKSFRALRNLVKAKKDIDIVIMRSNHEGEFFLLEHSPMKNLIENYKVSTSYNADRLARYAFEYAMCYKRSKITLAKNVETAPKCGKLFDESVSKIAKLYPKIKFESLSETAVITTLFKNPEKFDLILCSGLTGSLIAPMLLGLIGGVTLGCFGEISERYIVFEPAGRIRGTKLMKKNVANPTPFLLAGASVLNAVGAELYADYLVDGLDETFRQGVRTADIGGKATTSDFIKALIDNIKHKVPSVLCKHDLPLAKNKIIIPPYLHPEK
ncbi:isocitrate dehydrogenase [NAD] subunit gamma, mitochondrial [Cimex lectularius]|uniref:Isopropylmalate dehydrogenase-like domain-containing protein n=1 Tax=Cimex lectularius TaxID=79782 RepID=A0A8I6S8L3_CIMLE|nr:isocitrate dehydrogenase [NAD] subunit gamma, mitochondrial [Cimex lectularius]